MSPSRFCRNRQHCSTRDNYPRSELGYKRRKGSRPVHHHYRALYQVAVRQRDTQRVEQARGVLTTRSLASSLLILRQGREYRLRSHIERKSAQHLTVKPAQSSHDYHDVCLSISSSTVMAYFVSRSGVSNTINAHRYTNPCFASNAYGKTLFICPASPESRNVRQIR